MNSREETKTVKSALAKAGIIATVGHDRGTASCWLNIHVAASPFKHEHADTLCPVTCKALLWTRETRARVIQIAQQVTGRHGQYDGEISVHFSREPEAAKPDEDIEGGKADSGETAPATFDEPEPPQLELTPKPRQRGLF